MGVGGGLRRGVLRARRQRGRARLGLALRPGAVEGRSPACGGGGRRPRDRHVRRAGSVPDRSTWASPGPPGSGCSSAALCSSTGGASRQGRSTSRAWWSAAQPRARPARSRCASIAPRSPVRSRTCRPGSGTGSSRCPPTPRSTRWSSALDADRRRARSRHDQLRTTLERSRPRCPAGDGQARPEPPGGGGELPRAHRARRRRRAATDANRPQARRRGADLRRHLRRDDPLAVQERPDLRAPARSAVGDVVTRRPSR